MSKVIGLTLKVDGVEQSIKSVNELEQVIEELNAELKDTDIGSKRFKELTGELSNARSELKVFEKQFEGLEPQQKAESFVKLGEGIVGAFAIGSGALGLFGAESEELAKIQTRVQSAIAISIGVRQLAEARLQGAIALRIAQEKVYQVVQAATTLVVGGTTGALKAFRIALAATGIGLLIIALGALVANFDKVKKALGFVNNELDETKNKLAEVGQEAKSGTILMSKYRDIVLDTTRSEEERSTALERLKELGIDTNNINLDNEDSLRMLNERVEDSINLAIAKARVDAVLNLIKEKSAEQIKLENQELSESIGLWGNFTAFMKGYGNPVMQNYYATQTAIANKTEEQNDIQKDQNQLMEILKREMEGLFQLETKVYTQKRKSNQADKESNDLKDKEKKLIDALVDSYNRYQYAIDALNEVQTPVPETMEEILDRLEEQKTMLEEVITPFKEYEDAIKRFSSAEIPADEFGKFFFQVKEQLDDLFKEGLDPTELANFIDGQILKAQNVPFSDEAVKALKRYLSSGYQQVFKILGNDATLLKSVEESFSQLLKTPFDLEAIDNFENVMIAAYKSINSEFDVNNEEQMRAYEAFKSNLTGLLEGTKRIETEVKQVMENIGDAQREINNNLDVMTTDRFKLVEGYIGNFYEVINGYDQDYVVQYEKSLREQNKKAFDSVQREIKISNLSLDEKEKMLKKYEKMYKDTEDNITDKVKQASKDRFEEQAEGLLTFLDEASKMATEVANLINDLTQIQLQNLDTMFNSRFEKLDEQYQRDLDKAGNNVRAKNRLEEKYNKERIKLEEEYEKERRRLQKKALIADLIAKTLQIVSQTAVNIVKVFPNPFLMAAAGVLGLAQGGIAVAQYNAARKLKRGGILDGPLHAQGGIMMGDGSEAEGGEIVLTRGVAQNRQALSLANQANILGGGDNLINQMGKFDSQTLSEQGGLSQTPIFKTYVVADEVQRENVISKKIADRSKI